MKRFYGAAQASHQAKKEGRILLFGAALRAHRMKQEVGAVEDGPMMIGGVQVVSLGEMSSNGLDCRVPWDGSFQHDGNFEVLETSLETTVEMASRLKEEEAFLRVQEVSLKRQERKLRRREAKVKGRQKLLERLSRANFAAQLGLEAARQHREVTKQDLHRFLQGQTERKPLPATLRGDPANIAAARKFIEENFPAPEVSGA